MKPDYRYRLLLLVIIYSCKDAQKSTAETTPAPHTLKKISKYEMEIDSVTIGNFIHYQQFKQGIKEHFTFLNRIKRKIIMQLNSSSDNTNSLNQIEGITMPYFVL